MKNDAAGNLRTGIARRLSCKVVRLRMYNNSTPNHVLNAEPVRIDDHKRVSAVGEKRRQVSGVIRMWAFAGIIVATGLRIAFPSARAALMDVESEHAGRARRTGIRKPVDIRDDHHPLLIREELDGAGYIIFFVITVQMCACRGGVEE